MTGQSKAGQMLNWSDFFGLDNSAQEKSGKSSRSQASNTSRHEGSVPMAKSDENEPSTRDSARPTSSSRELKSKSAAEIDAALKYREDKILELQGDVSALKKALVEREAYVKTLESSVYANQARIHESENDMKSLYGRLKSAQNSLESQEASTKEITAVIMAKENEVGDLHGMLSRCQQDLRACQDDLFKLQPRAQISDADVAEEFNEVCHRIASWVDEEITLFENSHPKTSPLQLFSGGDDAKAARLLQKYPEAGDLWVKYEIHRCLEQLVFGKDVYLLGLPLEMKHALQEAGHCMASSQPPKDFAALNMWRSETLRALAATKTFENQKQNEVGRITVHIFRRLESIFPIVYGKETSIQKLYSNVMRPAAELALKMQMSATCYGVCVYREPFQHYNAVTVKQLKELKMIDVATRKTIRPESAVRADSTGAYGKILIPLEAGLLRIDKDNKEIHLRQRVYLMKLDSPLEQRHRFPG